MMNKIFLVDDDPVTNFVNEILIEQMKLAQRIEIFTHAQEALDQIGEELSEQEGPALILLDLNMPEFNGFDFIESFQSVKKDKTLLPEIVVLTSSQHDRDMKRLQELGIEKVLTKPLTKDKILSII